MSEPELRGESSPWLAVIDMQRVFAEPDSAWFTPRFDEIVGPVRELAAALRPRVTFTRFFAPEVPAGAWRRDYDQWPFALQPPGARIYQLAADFAARSGPALVPRRGVMYMKESQSRAAGAMSGLAVGDALGMPTQSLPRAQIVARYGGLLGGFEPAPPDHPLAAGMPAGSVTDDTEQALLIAPLLIEGGGPGDPARVGPRPGARGGSVRARGARGPSA